jgi:hypothetical protein
LLSRRTLLGATAAFAATPLVANASTERFPEGRRLLTAMKNAAWLETSIREGTEDLSRQWYHKDMSGHFYPGRIPDGEYRLRSRQFLGHLRGYLGEATKEGMIKRWSLGGISGNNQDIRVYLFFGVPKLPRHTFDLSWPWSTGWTVSPLQGRGFGYDPVAQPVRIASEGIS